MASRVGVEQPVVRKRLRLLVTEAHVERRIFLMERPRRDRFPSYCAVAVVRECRNDKAREQNCKCRNFEHGTFLSKEGTNRGDRRRYACAIGTLSRDVVEGEKIGLGSMSEI